MGMRYDGHSCLLPRDNCSEFMLTMFKQCMFAVEFSKPYLSLHLSLAAQILNAVHTEILYYPE